MVTFAAVQELALALPEAEQSTSYGTPAFKVRGTLFARLREQDVLVVKVDIDYREALTRSEPDTYFITPHYEKYPYVLVRLTNVEIEDLRELLTDAWRMSAPKRLAARFEASEHSG